MSFYHIKKIDVYSVFKTSALVFAVISFILAAAFLVFGRTDNAAFSQRLVVAFAVFVILTVFLMLVSVLFAFFYNIFAKKIGINVDIALEPKE